MLAAQKKYKNKSAGNYFRQNKKTYHLEYDKRFAGKGFTKIGGIIPQKVRQLKLESQFKKQQIFHLWDRIVEDVCGPKFKDKSKPQNIRNKTLFIDCLNSIWANELRFSKNNFIKKINKELQEVVIEEVRFIS